MPDESSAVKRGERKPQILDAAARLFYGKGYHATTIEDVAREVGMLKGSLYYYIKSKEDLLFELLYQVIHEAKAGVEEKLVGVTEPGAALEVAFASHIDHIIQHQVKVGLLLHEFGALAPERQQKVRLVMRQYTQVFVDILRRGQESGVFIAGDARLMANGILGMGNWLYKWYRADSGVSRDEVKQTFGNIVLGGVRRSS